MTTMRFSIARLMGFVVVVALGVGGLRNANETWASACFTLMLVTLVLAILHAVQTRGRDRAYWTGFAVTGWTYAAILFGPFGADDVSMNPSLLTQVLVDQLELLIHPEANAAADSITVTSTTTTFTPTPLAILTPAAPSPVSTPTPAASSASVSTPVVNVAPPVSIDVTAVGGVNLATSPGSPVIPTTFPLPTVAIGSADMTRVRYSQVAHSLSALVAGMLGGLYSAWLLGRRLRREAAVPPSAVV